MKDRYMQFLVLLIVSSLLIQPLQASEEDTVTIKFGNTSKVVIQFKDKDDLKKMTQYDINQMLKELSLSIDSAENANYIRIEDSTGTRYLNDTSNKEEIKIIELVDERSEPDDDDDEIDVSIRLGGIEFKVEGDKDDIEEEIEEWEDGERGIEKSDYEEDRSRKNSNHFNIDLGTNNYLEDDKFPLSNSPYSVKPWGSWYVALNSIQRTAVGGAFFVEWGAGVSWYNFKLENEKFKVTQGVDMVEFIDVVNVEGVKSKLTASYLNLSFVPVLDFSKGKKRVRSYGSGSFRVTQRSQLGFRIGAGVYGGYRLGSHSKFVSKSSEAGRDTDKDKDSFYLQNWRYGMRVQVGFKGTDLFVNYDLNGLFDGAQNPDLNAISFGITL